MVPVLTSLHLVQDASLWNGAAHIEGGSSVLGHSSLETSLLTHTVVCFHGDSKSSQADKENVTLHHPIYTSHIIKNETKFKICTHSVKKIINLKIFKLLVIR